MKLQKWQFLTNESTKSGRLITICNWDTYQNIETVKGKQKGKQRANKTPKNDNIQELINNNKILFGNSVLLKEEEYKKLCDKFGKEVADDWIERMNYYAASKPHKWKEYKDGDHYLTILNWDRMKQEREGKPEPEKQKYFVDMTKLEDK